MPIRGGRAHNFQDIPDVRWSSRNPQSHLYHLDCVSFDANLDRLLKQFHRNDELLPAFTRGQNSLDALQGATANSDSLAYLNEPAGRDREFIGQHRLYALDLRIRDRSRRAAYSHKAKHTCRTEHVQPLR